MRLLSKGRDDVADRKVQNTRRMIDQVIDRMNEVLDEVQEQAERVKEEIGEHDQNG